MVNTNVTRMCAAQHLSLLFNMCVIAKPLGSRFTSGSTSPMGSRLPMGSLFDPVNRWYRVTGYPTSPAYRTVCYFDRWSKDRPLEGKFLPEHMDAYTCTHIIVAHAQVESLRIKFYQEYDDETFAKIIGLRNTNLGLKILLSVGGYGAGSAQFTRVVSSNVTRCTFIKSAIRFLRAKHFDGLDINWKHPAKDESPAGDKQKFVFLMQELRSSFEREASTSGLDQLLLTGAFPAHKSEIDAGYDIRSLSAVMDFISIMAYNFYGPWENFLGFHSPMERLIPSEDPHAQRFLRWVSQYYESLGAPKSKLNLGIPTFGRSFELKHTNDRNGGAHIKGGGRPGPYTNDSGLLAYYEICNYTVKSHVTEHFDNVQRNPYMLLFRETEWVGYENRRSVKIKACYAATNGYGGVMFWDLSMDDFSGESCEQCPYPLIWAANSAMQNATLGCIGVH